MSKYLIKKCQNTKYKMSKLIKKCSNGVQTNFIFYRVIGSGKNLPGGFNQNTSTTCLLKSNQIN